VSREQQNPRRRCTLHVALLPNVVEGITLSSLSAIVDRWYCISFAYSDEEEHSYLAEDLAIRCGDFEEHTNIRFVAWVLVFIWPIGMVLVYISVLVSLRGQLVHEGGSSPLLRATTFLWRDYRPKYFYWEVRCRDPNRGCRIHSCWI
jgi:hypothetical protein